VNDRFFGDNNQHSSRLKDEAPSYHRPRVHSGQTMTLETPSFHFYFYFNYGVKSSFYIIMIDETIVDKKTSQSELILCQLGTKPMGKNLTTEHSHGVIIDSYFLVSDILECLKKKSS
jgi:hypothetical protein